MSTAEQVDIKETLRNYVLSSIAVEDLDDDDDLFESGIVNSLFAIQLMTFVERTFSLEMDSDDLDIENFKSLDATTNFILRKNGAMGS